ncbi:teicoplanin resistance protein VanZ [Croceibacterium aestuarii]|uniref:teicoplanin resistance protein VanZ n=1 Tax=Croceibacterium aestuarii TaxID=3064139 RepID=UPI00272E4DE8|nr:teicoplanin resistance protein VanZ [Croceibacterium sp. D39]
MKIVHCGMMAISKVFQLIFWLLLSAIFMVALMPAKIAPSVFASDKLNHMLAFFVLAAFAKSLWPRRGLLTIFAWLALYGGLIEILQWALGFGRDANWMDLAADLVAICFGLVAMSWMKSNRKSISTIK